MPSKTGLLRRALPALVVLMGLGSMMQVGSAQQGGPERREGADEAAIRQAEQAIVAAFRAKNLERVLAHYRKSGDLMVFDVGPKAVTRGWEEYRKSLQKVFHDTKSIDRLELRSLHVEVTGSLAVAWAEWHIATTPNEGAPQEYDGRLTDVLRKIDSKWLVVHEHNSVPIPGEAGPADPAVNAVEYLTPGFKGEGTSGVEGVATISPIHGGPVRAGERDSKPLPDLLRLPLGPRPLCLHLNPSYVPHPGYVECGPKCETISRAWKGVLICQPYPYSRGEHYRPHWWSCAWSDAPGAVLAPGYQAIFRTRN